MTKLKNANVAYSFRNTFFSSIWMSTILSMYINKSLMARYIYGISKPSGKRVQQIRDALHQFGKDLLSA